MAKFPAFIGPSYTLRSVNVDAQRTVNLYPEIDELGTGKEREVASLISRPGLTKLAMAGTGPWRGLFWASVGRTFGVSGAGFYEVTTPSAPSLLGTLTTGSGTVGMADNGIDLLLVDGAKGYHFTFATNTFAQITDPEFPPGANVAQFLDQYLLVNEPGTGRFWFSALSDATSWDGLDFGTAEGNPDNLATLLVDHRELILIGDRSVEVFWNSGDANSPFQRIQGRTIEEGGIAGTVQKLDNTVFYVSVNDRGNAIVKRLQGEVSQRISNHGVEWAIGQYGDISAATSYTYELRGHGFYCLNFPSADRTWVFDAATGLWHEETYTPTDGNPMQRSRPQCHAFDGTRHLVGDYVNGNLYQMDDSVYTDDGAAITRLRTAPHLSNGGGRVFHHRFQLDMEAGTGLATGQGSDPKVMLRWSSDGGHSWSNERTASMGKQGEYKQRAIWNRLGSDRDRIYEVKSTEPIKQVWISAFLETEAGAH